VVKRADAGTACGWPCILYRWEATTSTSRLLQRLGPLYGQVLAAYRRLVRTAVQAAGGQELDTQGDSFFVAFGRATPAVQAAVAIQQTLAEEPWRTGVADPTLVIPTIAQALGNQEASGPCFHQHLDGIKRAREYRVMQGGGVRVQVDAGGVEVDP
jgi:hypothetical protein